MHRTCLHSNRSNIFAVQSIRNHAHYFPQFDCNLSELEKLLFVYATSLGRMAMNRKSVERARDRASERYLT